MCRFESCWFRQLFPRSRALSTLILSPSTGAIGDTVFATGGEWGRCNLVAIEFDGTSVITASSSGDGSLSTSFLVPSGLVAGTTYTVAASSPPANSASAAFTVAASTEPPTPPVDPGDMWVGMDAGKWGSGIAAEVKTAVDYVRLDTPSTSQVTAWHGAGLNVIANVIGPYSSSGVSALNATNYANGVVALALANPGIVAIEILNEPGGTWFWGANALSTTNKTAYAHLLQVVHSAFLSAYGASPYPKLLASWDGGYNGGSNWGSGWLAADPSALSYVDGVTVHPYGGTTSRTPSALGNQANVTSARAATSLPIYVTEVGWPSGTAFGASSTGDSFQWTESEQADNVYNFVNWARDLTYVKAVIHFNYRDFSPNNYYGVTRLADGTHKKSFEDLRRAGLDLAQS